MKLCVALFTIINIHKRLKIVIIFENHETYGIWYQIKQSLYATIDRALVQKVNFEKVNL